MQAQLLQLSSIIKRPKTDGARTNTLFQDGVLKLVTILTCSSVDFGLCTNNTLNPCNFCIWQWYRTYFSALDSRSTASVSHRDLFNLITLFFLQVLKLTV